MKFMEMYIQIGDLPPIGCKPHCLGPTHFNCVKAVPEKLEKAGIIFKCS